MQRLHDGVVRHHELVAPLGANHVLETLGSGSRQPSERVAVEVDNLVRVLDEEDNTRCAKSFLPCILRPMPRFDAKSADCRIFTFKEGILSAVAHDLELVVRTSEIDVAEDRSSVTARCKADSMRLAQVCPGGRSAVSPPAIAITPCV